MSNMAEVEELAYDDSAGILHLQISGALNRYRYDEILIMSLL